MSRPQLVDGHAPGPAPLVNCVTVDENRAHLDAVAEVNRRSAAAARSAAAVKRAQAELLTAQAQHEEDAAALTEAQIASNDLVVSIRERYQIAGWDRITRQFVKEPTKP